mgnify:CR=1 FL=1
MNQDNIKVSEREKKCLEMLVTIYGNESDCMYMTYIAKELKLDYSQVRRAVRSLARKGLAEYLRGLQDDEGLVAGSGYRATEKGAIFLNPCKNCGKRVVEMTDGNCSDCYNLLK